MTPKKGDPHRNIKHHLAHLQLLELGTFAYSECLEADLLESGVVEDVSSVEDEGGSEHRLEEFVVVVFQELVPLGEQYQGVRTLSCLVGILMGRSIGEQVFDLMMRHLMCFFLSCEKNKKAKKRVEGNYTLGS